MAAQRKLKKEDRIKEYLEEMRFWVDNDDCENAHIQADNLLIKIIQSELGCEFDEILEAYDEVGKWFPRGQRAFYNYVKCIKLLDEAIRSLRVKTVR